MELFTFILAVVTIGSITLIADYARMLWMRRRLPPGPFPLPIVGNHFQTPKKKPWIEWERWSQYYESPMLTLWIGRHPRIILSDAWVASDLLEKRADVFSSRPRLVVMGDLINCTTTNQTTLVYGDRWRIHRKLMVSSNHFKVLKRCLISCSIWLWAPKLSEATDHSRPMKQRS